MVSSLQVKGFVQLNNIYYAGSHGMDIMAPPRPVRSSEGKYHTVSLDRKVNMISPFFLFFGLDTCTFFAKNHENELTKNTEGEMLNRSRTVFEKKSGHSLNSLITDHMLCSLW